MFSIIISLFLFAGITFAGVTGTGAASSINPKTSSTQTSVAAIGINTATVVSVTSASTVSVNKCNGYTELCDRQWSNITWIGSHDSAFYGDNYVSENQYQSVTEQLDYGIRTHFLF